ncbi:hypothetical protein AAB992_13990 [Burkholderia contaminans]|uniref:hypothetical protein n=1 Tax=Burkholderia contaminans TaxID=488447 RepID=UPI002415F1D8|nr:hypothetical protein [Burkholderia contaminans]WFN14416.1 hypothetical protein LXE92_36525 [Burkholderia contaminans]
MIVIVNVTTVPTAVPSGITPAGVQISITDPAGKPINDSNGVAIDSVKVASSPYNATFGNVPPGSYLAAANAIDTAGAAIGTPVTQPFTVANSEPNASTYDAPQSITVTVQ